ncbi:unnamed protein product [Gulo gulo]|uniref:G-protein coupled receptors family 1 profile domain-containing protein n=1 Tax=Gulo gulo TaxID=48420 RepID=A0A9X9LMT4_GULGU|nr:unnamed protein product [Gulo gulo]
MFALNTSEVEISTFLLIGIPGLEHVHIWVSIPICFIYLLAILGNCTILFVIKTEPSLHEPMYYFLSMLALSDLGLSFSSLPSMLRIFLFNAMEISADACIAQEFFIHGFTDMESSVLLIMSFDRFLAIRTPLRYSSILTSSRVLHIGLTFAIKSILLVLPLPFTLKRLRYSHGERLKALNTCVSHICAVLIFYVPIITLATMQHFAKHKSPLAMILIADAFLLVPPLMNPIVYCVKTRQIRVKVLEKLSLKSK